MQKQKKDAKIFHLARYCKNRRNVLARQRLLAMVHTLSTGDKLSGHGAAGWYQQRKRASQRLRNLSGGKLLLLENVYRGDHRRHSIKSLECEHVFISSLREFATSGFGADGMENFAKNACPFCTGTNDLRRCGSVAAVQELVWHRSGGKISFAASNILGLSDRYYTFGCEIHGCLFEATFTEFFESSEDDEFCTFCAFERPPLNE